MALTRRLFVGSGAAATATYLLGVDRAFPARKPKRVSVDPAMLQLKGEMGLTLTRGRLEEWPGPSNTGVPPGTVLTPVTSIIASSADNQIIENLDVSGGGYVEVTHNNVTVRRCRFTVVSPDPWAIYADTPGTITVEDCEFDGVGYGGPGEYGTHYVRRCEVRNAEDGIHVSNGLTLLDVRDCWFHDFTWQAPHHSDGVQCSVNASNFVFHHNFVEGTGNSSALQFWVDEPTNFNWRVTYNKLFLDDDESVIPLGGGGYTIRLPAVDCTANNLYVNHNRVMGGTFGVLRDDVPQIANVTEFIGNVYDDTGLPVLD